MPSLLDNIIWHSLAGPQAHLSCGTERARRYAPGFSPIIAFPVACQPDFAALAPFCTAGEQFYVEGWSGAAPPDWSIEAESSMFLMTWQGGEPADSEAGDAVALGRGDVDQAMALAALTHPGPFGPRTLELGDYFGLFDGPRLVAMAGERLHAGNFREISGVCTHPSSLGRGYTRRLMRLLIGRQLQRGQVPVLHVMSDNARAHGLYARMGFRDHRESIVRVLLRH